MIIPCPNCSARYTVDPVVIGADGRAMRCSSCGHTWLQRQVVAEAKSAATEAPPKPRPAAPPEDPSTEAKAPAAPIEDILPPASPLRPREDDRLPPPDELDDIPPEPSPPQAGLVDETDDASADERREPLDDEDTDAEPEPIPASLASTRAAPVQAPGDPRAWPSRGFVLSVSVVALFVVVLSAAVIAREGVIAAFPGARAAYEMIGLSTPIGAGLKIEDVQSSRDAGSDTVTLVIEGKVTNTADSEQPVPDLRVSLIDSDDGEVQFVAVAPDKDALVPGESLPFAARFEQPAPSARRIRITFMAAKQMTSSPAFARRDGTAH